jgi:peptidoglycan/LPS O-acetylase OafA/YrhL
VSPFRSKELDETDYRSEFRPDIQAMRALAVVLVVLYHAGIPGVHGGFFGVDVFFVISGFVITNVLLREKASKGTTSIPGFYGRRIRRILPAATVVLIATVFATYHWLSYITGALNANDAKYVDAFVGNFHFATLGTQYFTATQPPSTLQQFWSLAVEEQFYLVWPLLFLFITLPWKRFSPVPRLVVALTLVIGVSLAWCIIETQQNEVWAFFSPLTRAWELALGAMLAVVGPHLRGRNSPLHLVLFIVNFVAGVCRHCAGRRDRRNNCWRFTQRSRWFRAVSELPASSVGWKYFLFVVPRPLAGDYHRDTVRNRTPAAEKRNRTRPTLRGSGGSPLLRG